MTTTTGTMESTPDEETAPTAMQKARSALRSKIDDSLTTLVDMLHFGRQVVFAIPRTAKYPTEVFRQVWILIMSSAFVIIFIQAVSGFFWTTTGAYMSRQIGATAYIAAWPAWAELRLSYPQMIGWIVAAKVACGLVAEIGAARISDEIDALEVMGIESIVYMVATRILASLIVMPFVYFTGLVVCYWTSYVAAVDLHKVVSPGGYWTILWVLQNLEDIAYSFIIAFTVWLTSVFVGCYYGYTAKGGPVGVGVNTAKSMVVNIILISIIGMAFGQLFYGFKANAPVVN